MSPVTALDLPEIARRRRSTESLASIAEDYGVTRERIRQVLVAEYGTTWSDEISDERASERESVIAEHREKILELLMRGKPVSRELVVDDCPVYVTTIEEVMGEFAWAVAFPQTANEQVSDEEMYAAMRDAYAKVAPSPLTRVAYDAHRAEGAISGARISQRMAWTEACANAGVPSGTSRRSTYTRLDSEVAVAWVAAFLDHARRSGDRGSAKEYDTWAQAEGGPSMGAVRSVWGSWNNARAAAVPTLLEWQRAHPGDPLLPPDRSGTSQYTPEDVARWRKAREDNPDKPLRHIAAELGVAETTIRYHLTD